MTAETLLNGGLLLIALLIPVVFKRIANWLRLLTYKTINIPYERSSWSPPKERPKLIPPENYKNEFIEKFSRAHPRSVADLLADDFYKEIIPVTLIFEIISEMFPHLSEKEKGELVHAALSPN
jgi:hypothetical protein